MELVYGFCNNVTVNPEFTLIISVMHTSTISLNNTKTSFRQMEEVGGVQPPVFHPPMPPELEGLSHAGLKRRQYQRQTAYERHNCICCGRYFSRTSDLTRHLFVHTRERPYACSYCPYRTKQRSNLRKHISMQHHEASVNETSFLDENQF